MSARIQSSASSYMVGKLVTTTGKGPLLLSTWHLAFLRAGDPGEQGRATMSLVFQLQKSHIITSDTFSCAQRLTLPQDYTRPQIPRGKDALGPPWKMVFIVPEDIAPVQENRIINEAMKNENSDYQNCS